jgi:hypothetical protein
MLIPQPRRGDAGRSVFEYLALGVLAAVIVAGVAVSGVGTTLSASVGTVVCRITGGTNCGSSTTDGRDGTTPTGSPTGGQTATPDPTSTDAGGDQPSLADLQKQADAAQKAADKAAISPGNIMKQIIDLLKDFLGITDIQECLTKGKISSCLWAALDVGSLFFAALKIAKFGKAIKDALKLWKVFSKGRKALERAKAATKRVRELLKKRELACALPNSFVAGTPVILADGRSRPIEAIDVGDRVRAVDPRTGRTRPEPVLATIHGHGVKHLVAIRVSTDPYGLNSTTVTATGNHPFWSARRHTWINASRLRPNDVLAVRGHQPVRVVGVRPFTRTTSAYNLTVAGPHTYEVRPLGGVEIPVHNVNGACERLVGGQKLSNSRLRHIWDRHVRRTVNRNTDKFTTTSQSKLLKMVDRTIKQGKKVPGRFPGRSEYSLDYGHAIGMTKDGKAITKMRVVVEKGKIITAFPER